MAVRALIYRAEPKRDLSKADKVWLQAGSTTMST
jgi:hypothetical protein